MKQKIIISGINLFEAGPLSILEDCLEYCSKYLTSKYIVIALVHNKNVLNYEGVKLVEFPNSRKSYLRRLYYEYYFFKKISLRFKPELWFSLHDISPNVYASQRVVYCHNASPFYKAKLKDWNFSYKIVLFSWFYKFLYKINIKKNDYVIVQQNWMAAMFKKAYKLADDKLIVAYPNVINNSIDINNKVIENEKHEFFYPAFPRPFKNFELICQACEILEQKSISNFVVYLTIDGSENKYSNWVKNKFSHLKTVNFIGQITREQVFEYYQKINCLLFPSRLETWGLPISEFSAFNKAILAANLPYAYETSSNCSKISYFDIDNPQELAGKMKSLIIGNTSFLQKAKKQTVNFQLTNNWGELFDKLLAN